MLLMNQLSTSMNRYDESKGSNKECKINGLSFQSNGSHSNSRQLFRKCKHIIQEQMMQINTLSEENESLHSQIKSAYQQKSEIQAGLNELQFQHKEIKSKNEILHKEMNKLNKLIQEMETCLQEKQNIIKLSNNKVEMLEDSLLKVRRQYEVCKQKCILLESTVDLMTQQNQRINDIVQEKESQIQKQIQQLKKLRNLFQKSHALEEFDSMISQKLSVSRHPQQDNNLAQNFFAIGNQNPFQTIQVRKYPNKSENHHNKTESKILSKSERLKQNVSMQLLKREHQNSRRMGSISVFNTIEQRVNTSPVSRIRKNNGSREKVPIDSYNPNTNHRKQNQNDSSILSVPRTTSSQRKPSTKRYQNQQTNPELETSLLDIKKEILEQYGKVELKKEMMNQQMISKTLQQIEQKLERMNKISSIDLSESQME